MNNTSVIFEKRYEFAYKLKQVMHDKSYTKARLCKEADISRPTLDKLLSCGVTNLTNLEKYVSRISKCLDIEPEALVYGIDAVEPRKDRYLKHMISDSLEEIENFVNDTNRIEIVNIYGYPEGNTIRHVLIYWLYEE